MSPSSTKLGEGTIAPTCLCEGLEERNRRMCHCGYVRDYFSMSSSLMSTIGHRALKGRSNSKGRRHAQCAFGPGRVREPSVTRSQPSRIFVTPKIFVILYDQDTILQCMRTTFYTNSQKCSLKLLSWVDWVSDNSTRERGRGRRACTRWETFSHLNQAQ